MKNVLLLAALLACTTFVKAQDELGEDVTPFNYVFDNLPDGDIYPFGKAATWWWPDRAEWPTMTADGQFEGFVGFNCDSDLSKVYQAGTSVIDLGGNVGKVFCIKGAECPDDLVPGAPKCDASKGGWNCNTMMYTFTTSANPNDAKANVFKIVMKAVYPDKSEKGWGLLADNTSYYEHTTGDRNLAALIGKVTLGEFGAADEWLEVIVKYNHSKDLAPDKSETFSKPGSVLFEFSPSTLKDCAFLIKEMSFYKDPTFTEKKGVVTKKLVKLASSGVQEKQAQNKISCTTNNGDIQLQNLASGDKIVVTSLSGMVVKEVIAKEATETFSLESGYYTVSVKGQNFKVMNK